MRARVMGAPRAPRLLRYELRVTSTDCESRCGVTRGHRRYLVVASGAPLGLGPLAAACEPDGAAGVTGAPAGAPAAPPVLPGELPPLGDVPLALRLVGVT